jgi:hypothetical protein
VASCLPLLVIGATARAAPQRHTRSSRTTVQAASTISRPLSAAAKLSTQADHKLVSDAKALKLCLRENRKQPRRCDAARSAVQRMGRRLARAERRLARIARETAKAHSASIMSTRQPPQLTVTGYRLSWTRVANVNSYLLVRQVPGQGNQYSVVSGTSTTPPPVPGVSVAYSVRTAVYWSAWSDQQTITYPSPTPSPAPSPTPPSPPASPAKPVDTQAAPAISVSGETLTWNAVTSVNTYVLVSKVAGQPERFTAISGTSTTPAPVPGATVHYSVRTAVDDSAWAPEVAISYPAVPTPPKEEKPPPTEEPAPKDTGFQPGVDSGWDLPEEPNAAAQIGVKVVRVAFTIGASPAEIEKFIVSYAEKGIRVAPLAVFAGSIMPSAAEAQNLASWAKTYGPRGTFWAHRTDGNLAIQTIEFGNETSAGYQYGDEPGDPSYTERAKTYATRFKEAAEAIKATGIEVGLLAVGEDPTGDWMNGMFSAVPNLGSYVGGWVSHLYGPRWRSKLEDLISHSAAHGAPASIPIDVTEWGLSGENTICVTEDYDWNPCMNYQETGETLRRNVGEIRQMLGSRLGLFIFFQLRDQRNVGETGSPFYYFGVVQKNWEPKGYYTAAAKEVLAE